jgi:HTH-type transcriptional regulator / antitoxin HipB
METMLEPYRLAMNVLRHRRAAGLSRNQLAELAGVGKTVVYDIENGKETVQLDSLRKILKVLNIRVQLASPLIDRLINYKDETSTDIDAW